MSIFDQELALSCSQNLRQCDEALEGLSFCYRDVRQVDHYVSHFKQSVIR